MRLQEWLDPSVNIIPTIIYFSTTFFSISTESFLFIFSSQFAGMRARPIGPYGDRGALSPIYLIYNNPIPIREGRLSPLYKYFIPGVIEIRDKRCKLLMYCHQYSFGGKYDLIQLHRQIIHQNDGIFIRNLLKPSPPAFSI